MSEGERADRLSFGEPDEVTRMLGEMKDVDPPADLVRTVMSRISSGPALRSRRVEPVQFSGGKRMAKKVLWSVMGAAAAVLIVMKLAGYPPKSDGTEGTIGAAQRYQSQQIAEGDVKVTDAELQKFLQSDAFHKLASDKVARQALANKDLQKALADPNVRLVLANDQIRLALANDQIRLALASEEVRLALANEQLRLALANEQLRLVLANDQLRLVLANDQLRMVLASDAVAAAVASPALIGMLSAPGFAEAVASPGFVAAMVADSAAAGATAH
jgi:hypothetical protein